MTNITVKMSRINVRKTSIGYTPEGEFGGASMKNNSKVVVDMDAMTITAPEEYFGPKKAKARPVSEPTDPVDSIRMALEMAADRAATFGATPATRKQTSYLASLINSAGRDAGDIGCDITNMQATLTKGAASDHISQYMAG